jgi:hypothetical protein
MIDRSEVDTVNARKPSAALWSKSSFNGYKTCSANHSCISGETRRQVKVSAGVRVRRRSLRRNAAASEG